MRFLIILLLIFSCTSRKEITLISNAEYFLNKTKLKESKKDATCWTTLRLIDDYSAGKRLSDAASLLKVESLKIIMTKIWHQASINSKEKILAPKDVLKVLPLRWKNDPFIFQNIIDLKDDPAFYNLTTSAENWRTLLSIVQDKVYNPKEFPEIIPLSPQSADLLAKLFSLISKDLLKGAFNSSNENKKKFIEIEDIKKSFKNLSLAVPEKVLNSTTPFKNKYFLLKSWSKTNVQLKIESLEEWNKEIHGEKKNYLNLMNKLTSIPFTKDGYSKFFNKLIQISAFILGGNINSGFAVNKPFTILMDNRLDKKNQKVDYLSLVKTFNALNRFFPRVMLSNGDVNFLLVPNLVFKINKDIKKTNIYLNAEDLDSFRDTLIPWLAIKKGLEKSESRPIDPFAMELLAERVAELGMLLIKNMEMIAKQKKRNFLTAIELMEFENHHYYFISDKKTNSNWFNKNKKKKLLKEQSPPYFVDITKNSGVDDKICQKKMSIQGIYQYAHTQNYIGSGISVGDINGDGLIDFFYPGEGCNQLYINLGRGRFFNGTKEWGLEGVNFGFTRQALFADINNDGRLDLFVVDSEKNSRLFIQKLGNIFLDITEKSKIKTNSSAQTATFLDFDKDGLLDLYVGHYGVGFPSISGLNGGGNLLFKNKGNAIFENVTQMSKTGSTRWTMAVAAFDFNRDGLQDIFVGNALGFDELFLNMGDGKFKEVGKEIGLLGRGHTMNASFTDFNNDGYWDLYVTLIDMFSKNQTFIFPRPDDLKTLDEKILKSTLFLTGNKLFLNNSGKSFSIDHEIFEPVNMGLSWSANFFDYENDGDEDLYLTNGYIDGVLSGNQKNIFFLKNENKYFSTEGISAESFLGNSRSAASVDIDDDGLLDLIVTNYDNKLKILKNIAPPKNNWIKISLKGVESNFYGIGSTVSVVLKNGKILRRAVSAGSNYLSQDDTTLNFGLGSDSKVKEMNVIWPSGITKKYKGPFKSRRKLVLEENGILTELAGPI